MKKILIALFAVIMSFNVTTAFAEGGTQVKKNDANIVYSGRWMGNAGGMNSGWQSTCKISFTGTSLQISGTGDVIVQIDDAQPVDFTLSNNTVVAKDLKEGEHIAIIMPQKYTIKMVIKGFTIDKGASVFPLKWTPTIECVGDSLTAGGFYLEKDGNYLTKHGYPFKLGKMLGWNFYAIAQSGIALCRNDDTTVPMSEKYADWSLLSSDKANKDKAIEKHPDYIIVSLGANDHSPTSTYNGKTYPSEEEFEQTYIQLITQMRTMHPNAVIFVAYAFTGGRKAETKRAVEYFNSDKVVLVDTTVWNLSGYRVSDNTHYTDAGNEYIASKFYDVIMDYVSAHPIPTATATPQPTQTVKPTEQTNVQATEQATNQPTEESTPTATQTAEAQEDSDNDSNALPFIIGGIAAGAVAGGATAVIIKKKKTKKDEE